MDADKETKELDEVLDLFISSDEKRSQDPWPGLKSKEKPKTEKAHLPLLETTNISKEIACPSGPTAQDKIRGLLFEYLQADYEITRVELRKITDRRDRDREVHTQEKVSLILKNQ
ncbi:MAG: hypothetical protein DRH12_17465 [Deltaproteobacteria bacterium]|nr:MAG: hypothetical protein DRH12_17465 [Deltaproteobacteria bacterium]